MRKSLLAVTCLLAGCSVSITQEQLAAAQTACDANGGIMPGTFVTIQTTVSSASTTARCKDGKTIEVKVKDSSSS